MASQIKEQDTDWNRIPDQTTIEKAMAGLKLRNFNPVFVPDRKAALEQLKKMIPSGAEVMTGGSTTLEEIGFIELLASNQHPWQNWKDRIFAEKAPEKQSDLRRAAITAEYFIGSVQAVAQTGQVLGTEFMSGRASRTVYPPSWWGRNWASSG